MKAPTMTDVARRAGVSHATVSRVVNGRSGVGSATEARVRKAIADLQYLAPPAEQRPGRSAAPVPGLRSRHVALVTFDRSLTEHSAFVASVYEGARRAGLERGVTVSLLSLDDCDAVPDWVHPDNLDGLLLHGLHSRDHLVRAGREIPSLWLTTHDEEGADAVLPGNREVGRMAAGYLAERGHRRVAALSLDRENPSYRVRLEAFVAEARQRGMTASLVQSPKRAEKLPPEEKMQRLVRSIAAGRNGRKPGKPERATGLFLPSDRMAALAHAACRREGLDPGTDFDFISCDNEDAYLAGLHPRPATIDLGTGERGRLALEMLLDRIENPGRDRRATLLLDPVLVAGE